VSSSRLRHRCDTGGERQDKGSTSCLSFLPLHLSVPEIGSRSDTRHAGIQAIEQGTGKDCKDADTVAALV